MALDNEGVMLGQFGRPEEAVVVYNEVVAHLGGVPKRWGQGGEALHLAMKAEVERFAT